MDQENMFFKNQDKLYTMIDPYLYDGFFEYKNTYNYYGLMLIKYYYLKKVMVNILLDVDHYN